MARILGSLRRMASIRLLPPRRMSRAEREAVERRIVEDPVVLQALDELIARRPQFSRKRDAVRTLQDRA